MYRRIPKEGALYRIIGSDGKEYGPVAVEQMRQWMAEGRVNAKTRVLAEGTTEWKTLAEFPELAPQPQQRPPQPPNPTSPPIQPSGVMAGKPAVEQLNGPATGLIVTAILGFVLQALGFLGNVFGLSQGVGGFGDDASLNLFTGAIGIVFNAIGVAVGVLILVGALKMKKLESHSWATAASVLALIPCISPCCFVGLPIGIWSLIVLAKPEVKGAFH